MPSAFVLLHTELTRWTDVYLALRGPLFTGFLTMSGLLLTALSLLVTRIHDLMRDPMFQARARAVAAHLGPEHPAQASLHRHTRLMRRAVWVCLLVAGLQVTLGLAASPMARMVCLAAGVGGLATVAWSVHHVLESYLMWLRKFDELRHAALLQDVEKLDRERAAARHRTQEIGEG